MRPDLAERTAQARSKILVLGPRGTAERIAGDLRQEGFEPILPEALSLRVPQDSDRNEAESLRESLDAFKAWVIAHPERSQGYVHPGTSAWGERPEFPQLCQELGLEAIAAPSRVLSLFSNKLTLLAHAEKLHIPHAVIGFDPLMNLREVESFLRDRLSSKQKTPFPLVLKAVKSGRRGSSVHVIHSAEELTHSLPKWLSQQQTDSSQTIFFLERYLEGARYLSLPFARSSSGTYQFFPIVDGSLQQRHRRLIDLCPAQGVSLKLMNSLHGACEKFLNDCHFVGVGTLDFMVDDDQYYLVDGLARLHHGYSLWEKVSGVKVIPWQLAALGLGSLSEVRIPQKQTPEVFGALMRVRAEDPWTQIPQPGLILEQSPLVVFEKTGVEFEPSYQEGEQVSFDSDGYLGSLLAVGGSREEPLGLLAKVLDQTWIGGSLQTNERLLSELLHHPWIKEGYVHAGFIDEEFLPNIHVPPHYLQLAVNHCADRKLLESASGKYTAGGNKFSPTPLQGVWMAPPREWSYPAGTVFSGHWVFADKSERVHLMAFPLSSGRVLARVGSWFFQIKAVGTERRLTMNALTSGRVHSIRYRAGSTVLPHEPVVFIESLHTLVSHSSPISVKILEWKVDPDQEVIVGDVLATVEKNLEKAP